MGQQPVGIAILGAGRWGTHLTRHFFHHPDAHLRLVADPNPSQLDTLDQRFGLTQAGVRLTTHWPDVLTQEGIAAVAIATPAATHTPLVQAALERGYHVLVEKPLTLNVAEAIALCHLADRQNCLLVVDHTYLFHPAVIQGAALIRKQGIGSLRYGYASRTHLGPVRQDVDALWDLAIHDLAIFNLWVDEFPEEVQASGEVWLQPSASAPQFPTGLADLVWIRVRYPSGFHAVIHVCWLNPDKQRRLTVVGSEGALIFDEMQPDNALIHLQGQILRQGEAFVPSDCQRDGVPLPDGEPLGQVCGHFLQCVQRREPSDVTPGWRAVGYVQILAAIATSLQWGGCPVSVEPPHPLTICQAASANRPPGES
ncbi:MAG: Gfo/Idh/MocA family oxidoreductase [Synechococcales bacterium]|nr:Gfo/Idh/MocA family oxidoreductase [Synechococcales bacterium]